MLSNLFILLLLIINQTELNINIILNSSLGTQFLLLHFIINIISSFPSKQQLPTHFCFITIYYTFFIIIYYIYFMRDIAQIYYTNIDGGAATMN